ncbi:helix-turn-helix domain-containing protein [Budviciaceae bacterium BWR-B9]|uniref:Helix-turn-helix domain-containing protein n=1 Tax=Limnobaculum allomyrinae TaxID=2791986 RepID=A0ABS1IMW7_9GAMM|nr:MULTISPECIES: helix-turn-helix domain-containing protein [Limnobaculum]MBK5143081.1 helix-turn-helix domain-containing protein [Limnobaculum allomyrinae]MBV7693411.1 helix-turn-helix domain-containing protein [Limnobaculum sp. M2-1]
MDRGDRLLTYTEGSAILGLSNTYSPPLIHLYIKPAQTSTIYTLPAEEAQNIIKSKNLFESENYVQNHNTASFFQLYEKTITPNNYAFIRTLLMDLEQNSDAIKTSVTVAAYIIKRSGMSRSYVMLVLSELRKGGYIHMEDGKLTGITSLPERF